MKTSKKTEAQTAWHEFSVFFHDMHLNATLIWSHGKSLMWDLPVCLFGALIESVNLFPQRPSTKMNSWSEENGRQFLKSATWDDFLLDYFKRFYNQLHHLDDLGRTPKKFQNLDKTWSLLQNVAECIPLSVGNVRIVTAHICKCLPSLFVYCRWWTILSESKQFVMCF